METVIQRLTGQFPELPAETILHAVRGEHEATEAARYETSRRAWLSAPPAAN
jgi:hypothetical protein